MEEKRGKEERDGTVTGWRSITPTNKWGDTRRTSPGKMGTIGEPRAPIPVSMAIRSNSKIPEVMPKEFPIKGIPIKDLLIPRGTIPQGMLP
jgi:hypothetical protein